MNPDNYGLIEMTLSFGVVLGLALWQLVTVRRALRKGRAEDAARKNSGG